MIILIAESKTMSTKQQEIPATEYAAFGPLYSTVADSIMGALRERTPEELAEEAGITLRLAKGLHQMIYDFPNKTTGYKAIKAFTGVVFRQLHPEEYDISRKKYMDRNVRIISSLYGWLHPHSIIKPYRFDFNSHVAPGEETLMKYWKKDVTIALVNELRLRGEHEIVDLLPSDASKCIDWKLVKRFAKVYRIDFKVPSGAESMKTPHAGRLKELRGRMLDIIIRKRLEKAGDITSLAGDDFIYLPDMGFAGTFSFLTI